MMQIILDNIKKQGFNVIILCGVIYWFNVKYDNLDARYDNLNAYVRDEFKKVIERNTEAYNNFVNKEK